MEFQKKQPNKIGKILQYFYGLSFLYLNFDNQFSWCLLNGMIGCYIVMCTSCGIFSEFLENADVVVQEGMDVGWVSS